MNHSSTDRFVGWGLVLIQGLLIGAVVLVPRDPAWDGMSWLTAVAWAGIIIALILGVWAGGLLGKGLTPVPLPNGQTDLVTRGPYRWVRHPIYTAVMVGVAGIALRSRTPIVLGMAALLVVFLGLKARWEERHLAEAFAEYETYRARTGRFLPRIGT